MQLKQAPPLLRSACISAVESSHVELRATLGLHGSPCLFHLQYTTGILQVKTEGKSVEKSVNPASSPMPLCIYSYVHPNNSEYLNNGSFMQFHAVSQFHQSAPEFPLQVH